RILEQASADQAAHRVGDQVDAKRAAGGLVVAAYGVAHLLYQPGEPFGVDRDIRPIRIGIELSGDLIIVPVDDDAFRPDAVIQVTLIPADIDVAVIVVLHQPDERRLEDESLDRLVPPLTDLGRAEVEAHVWRGDGLLD